MPTDDTLIRIGVRLPSAAYAKLKEFATANNVPMAVVIRLLVAEWVENDSRARPPALV